jgi:hypothetical protein
VLHALPKFSWVLLWRGLDDGNSAVVGRAGVGSIAMGMLTMGFEEWRGLDQADVAQHSGCDCEGWWYKEQAIVKGVWSQSCDSGVA